VKNANARIWNPLSRVKQAVRQGWFPGIFCANDFWRELARLRAIATKTSLFRIVLCLFDSEQFFSQSAKRFCQIVPSLPCADVLPASRQGDNFIHCRF